MRQDAGFRTYRTDAVAGQDDLRVPCPGWRICAPRAGDHSFQSRFGRAAPPWLGVAVGGVLCDPSEMPNGDIIVFGGGIIAFMALFFSVHVLLNTIYMVYPMLLVAGVQSSMGGFLYRRVTYGY